VKTGINLGCHKIESLPHRYNAPELTYQRFATAFRNYNGTIDTVIKLMNYLTEEYGVPSILPVQISIQETNFGQDALS